MAASVQPAQPLVTCHSSLVTSSYSVKLQPEFVVDERQARLAPREGEVRAAQRRYAAPRRLDAVGFSGEDVMQSRVRAQGRAILDRLLRRAIGAASVDELHAVVVDQHTR